MNKISRISAALVVFLGIAAFILSYAALQATAKDNGIDEALSHLFPLIVDGFILVASLSVLWRSLSGESTIYPWLLVVFFSVLSVGFNVSHAQEQTLARIIASVPPLALLLSFELLMSQIRSDIRRRGIIQTLTDLTNKVKQGRQELTKVDGELTMARDKLATIDQQVADKQGQLTDLDRQANEIAAAILDGQETLSSLEKQIADAENRRQAALDRLEVVKQAGANLSAVVEADGKLSKADRQPLVLRLTKEGFDPAAIADRLGVVERTIKRDLSELNGQVTK